MDLERAMLDKLIGEVLESQFGLKICFGYNRNYKAMLIVVNGALDTLALVTSLDYLSPLLLEPIPKQGQDQRRVEEMAGGHGGGIAYKDLTMHKAKRWHTITGKGLCAVMWAKQDSPLVLGGDIHERLNAEKALIQCQDDIVLVNTRLSRLEPRIRNRERFDDQLFSKERDRFYREPYYALDLRIGVDVYEMPTKITYDFRNTCRDTDNLTSDGSPVHRLIDQHSVDYCRWADLIGPESVRLLKTVETECSRLGLNAFLATCCSSPSSEPHMQKWMVADSSSGKSKDTWCNVWILRSIILINVFNISSVFVRQSRLRIGPPVTCSILFGAKCSLSGLNSLRRASFVFAILLSNNPVVIGVLIPSL
ncbi:hypothetical protein DKX38_011338 [Salix brachista]|uniref:Uncharacterized protein n=1 Tax=Salix brachista TaxID=2182728 RepID=A0A5N5LZ03_9ROSI|nr:hypothetical protein DKX38_011338 [Salix brachista]